MNPKNHNDQDPRDALIDQCLAQHPVRASDDFLQRLHREINEASNAPVDKIIDDCLANQSKQASPNFNETLHAHLQNEPRSRRFPSVASLWAPLAAAASFVIAGLWIQDTLSSSPENSVASATNPHPIEDVNLDAQTAQIFALAQNLKSHTDLSRVPGGIETLALLDN